MRRGGDLERHRIPSPVGRLEAELVVPELARGQAVVAHPYPPMGGSMDNNVVHAVCDAFAASGIAALRFNFRGVGKSEGEFDDGRGEVDDVRAAIEFARTIVRGPTIVAGYSFGAAMAARACAGRDDIAALVLISPPEQMFALPPVEELPGPIFVLAGGRDDFIDAGEIRERFAVRTDARVVVNPRADHFWIGEESRVAAEIEGFARVLDAIG